MTHEQRIEFLTEIQRLRHEIITCPYCAVRRDRICDIYNVMPPDPVIMRAEQIMQAVRVIDRQADTTALLRTDPKAE